MRKSIFFASLLVLATLFAACDYVNPEPEDDDPAGNRVTLDTPIQPQKRVLIEDYTGHGCKSCPRSHRALKDVLDQNNGDVVGMAIHAGFFADATGLHGSDLLYDFTTELGVDLDDLMGASSRGNPQIVIDHREIAGDILVEYLDMGPLSDSLLGENPTCGLRIENTFNETNRELSVSVEIEYFQAASEDDYLIVALTEDSIVKPQLDQDFTTGPAGNPNLDMNYVHNHVLRAGLTSYLGRQISGTDIEAGDQFRLTFDTTLDAEWVAGNCHLIAYVVTNDGGYLPVQNVAEVKLN